MTVFLRAAPICCLIVLVACGEKPPNGLDEDAPPLLAAAEHGDFPALEALLADKTTPDVRDACHPRNGSWTPPRVRIGGCLARHNEA